MASLIMAAEPLVVPVAATVVLQPLDTGSCACGLQHELTCDAWEGLESSHALLCHPYVAVQGEALCFSNMHDCRSLVPSRFGHGA